MKLEEMTMKERSLLLYFETRATDHGGLVDAAYMNNADMEIAKTWDEIKFVKFGRIASACLQVARVTHWCELSEEAWQLAHAARRARYIRLNNIRKWVSAEEVGAAP